MGVFRSPFFDFGNSGFKDCVQSFNFRSQESNSIFKLSNFSFKSLVSILGFIEGIFKLIGSGLPFIKFGVLLSDDVGESFDFLAQKNKLLFVFGTFVFIASEVHDNNFELGVFFSPFVDLFQEEIDSVFILSNFVLKGFKFVVFHFESGESVLPFFDISESLVENAVKSLDFGGQEGNSVFVFTDL